MNQKEIAEVLRLDRRVDGYKDSKGFAHFFLGTRIGFSMQEKKGKKFDIQMVRRAGYDLGEIVTEKNLENVTLNEALIEFIQFRKNIA